MLPFSIYWALLVTSLIRHLINLKPVHIGSPGNVSLNARGSRSLSMTWTSPTNLKEKHGSFVAYTVKCWSEGQTTASYKLANVTQIIIEQCLPFSMYNCCVSLQTTQANSTAVCQQQSTPEDGKSYTHHYLAMTPPFTVALNFLSAPESPPIVTSIDNSNPYSIVVYWSPPLRPNGVITRYNLYIGYETQSGMIDRFTTDGQSTSYNISNLLPYQQISIEVTASTRIGEGPSSINETRTAQARMLDYYIICGYKYNIHIIIIICHNLFVQLPRK